LSGTIAPLEEIPPVQLFGSATDETWRWLHFEGRKRCPFLERYLSGFTDDPSFVRPSRVGGSRVLDFVYRWGRTIRFYIKELKPLAETPPFQLFGGASDETWQWLLLRDRERCPFLERYLPGLPEDPEFARPTWMGAGPTEALEKGFPKL
jgi:hypothetical protein